MLLAFSSSTIGSLVILLAIVAVVFLFIVPFWRIFQKAGYPGWAILVPIYNSIVQLQVAKLSPWLILVYLLALIPFVGIIVSLFMSILVTIKLGQAFNKSTGFIIGMFFLPFIFIPILGYGNSQYDFDEEYEVEVA